MRRIISLHLLIAVLLVGIFFILGSIDKARLEKASLTHDPDLIFAHQKIIILDGGSVMWESLIYHAYESRRMEVIADTTMEAKRVTDGFQGVRWEWKLHNLLWILALVGISFAFQILRGRKST